MKKRLYIGCLVVCLLWTAFIFARSLKSGAESSQESGAALALVDRVLAFLGVAWRPSELLLRKLGHFSEYFVLGALAYPSVKLFTRRFSWLWTWGYALAVALLDEFLMQNLSVGRGPSMLDVLIDASGAALSLLLLLCLSWLWKKRKNKVKF